MTYPPNVQKLLDSLPEDQARFQRGCIELVRGLQILLGLILVVGCGLSFWGLLTGHPHALFVLACLQQDCGWVAGYLYQSGSALIGVLGLKAVLAY